MAPSWTVNDSAGPAIFQPVKSLPLKRLVNPGSTAGAAFCNPTDRSHADISQSFMVAPCVCRDPVAAYMVDVEIPRSLPRAALRLCSRRREICFDPRHHIRICSGDIALFV